MNYTERGLEVADILEEIDTRVERLTKAKQIYAESGNQGASQNCKHRISELAGLRKFITQE